MELTLCAVSTECPSKQPQKASLESSEDVCPTAVLCMDALPTCQVQNNQVNTIKETLTLASLLRRTVAIPNLQQHLFSDANKDPMHFDVSFLTAENVPLLRCQHGIPYMHLCLDECAHARALHAACGHVTLLSLRHAPQTLFDVPHLKVRTLLPVSHPHAVALTRTPLPHAHLDTGMGTGTRVSGRSRRTRMHMRGQGGTGVRGAGVAQLLPHNGRRITAAVCSAPT